MKRLKNATKLFVVTSIFEGEINPESIEYYMDGSVRILEESNNIWSFAKPKEIICEDNSLILQYSNGSVSIEILEETNDE